LTRVPDGARSQADFPDRAALAARAKWYMAAVAHFEGARDAPGPSLARLFAIARRICAGLLMLGCCGFAPAEELMLVWIAPSECPQAADVQTLLGRLLAESSTALDAMDATAQIERVRGHRFRLKLRLQLGAHRAERALESNSCEELTRTAAWLIAVAIDPTVHAEENSHGAAPVAESASEQAPAGSRPAGGETSPRGPLRDEVSPSGRGSGQPQAAGRPPARARLRPLQGRIGLLAGASFGTADGTQAELGSAGGLGAGWLYSELELSVLLPRREELGGGGMVRSWSLRLGLRECALWGTRLRWGPCATLDVLRTVGHAEGLSINQPDQALFWAVAGLALRVAWNLAGSLELGLAGGLGVAISPRPGFSVEGVGEVAPASAWPSYVRIGFGFLTR
jgi:hypothetical protein